MKKFNKIILPAIMVLTFLFIYSCDPFDDIYLTLAMDIEFNVPQGIGSEIDLEENLCLSDFDDYDDNKENLEEILYVSSAYFTISATDSLSGDNLILTVYQANRSTVLFQYIQDKFVANDYINKPIEIVLSEQEKIRVNNYLKDPQVDKCFYATFKLSNVEYNSPSQFYFLNSKMEFLTQLKVKP
jgi:hypothetical protein